MVTASLKMWCFSHHSPKVVLLPSPTEQLDIHHPAVEMECGHIKQRRDHFVSLLLLGVIITTNTSAQHNIFPSLAAHFLLFSDFYTLLLLMLGSIQWHLHAWPICLWLFSASAVWNTFFFFWHSRAAPVENETFTILLDCESELCEPKQGGRAPFLTLAGIWETCVHKHLHSGPPPAP